LFKPPYKMLFDCIIPFGPNEETLIHFCIQKARENIIGLRNIYVISYTPSFFNPDAITIYEKDYDFTYEDINTYIQSSRTGWYLQQFLKIYSHRVIEDLSEYFLILDSDTIFLNKTNFFDDGVPLYATGTEYHIPYFENMNRMHSSLNKCVPYSGICHHMIFKKEYLQNIIDIIELRNEKDFWRCALESISSGHHQYSGFSEYELYFTYLNTYQKDSFKIRNLRWKNTDFYDSSDSSSFDYISIHWYMRKNNINIPIFNFKKVMCYIRGGLGNQLFQIAATYNFALKHKYKLILQDVYNVGDRVTYYNNLLKNLSPFKGNINGKWYTENDEFKFVDIPNLESDMIICGFFHSEKFFKENEKKVRKLFKLPNDLEIFVQNKKKEYKLDDEILIGIHIRRTDFLLIQEYQPVQMKEYFENAKKYIEEKLGFKPTYIYITDDKKWTNENFELINKDKIIDFPNDYEEFSFLRNCHHYIISNSTFSWWGAWLSDLCKDKIVIYPKNWFGPKNNKTTENIFCDGWIGI
jgi:hypothetical protein